MPHLEAHGQVNSTQTRQMGAAVLRRLDAVAAGKVTPEGMQQQADSTRRLVRSKYRSDAAASAALSETNAHMREHEPKLHAGFNSTKTPELAGLGNEPIFVLPLVEENQARKTTEVLAAHRGNWLKDERQRQAAPYATVLKNEP